MLDRLKNLVDGDNVEEGLRGAIEELRGARKELSVEDFNSLKLHALSKGKAEYVYLVIAAKELHEESSEPDSDVMNSICENNCEELVKDLSTRELKGKTKVLSLLFLLANDRFEDVREFLNSDGKKEILQEAFCFALRLGDVKSVLKVLELDVDVNTALILAAQQQGHEEVVKLLIRRGADPSIKNAAGQTALDVASDENKDIIKEEWARIKLAPVAGYILGAITTVGCAGAAYGMLALTAVNSLLAGAAIGVVLAVLLERTCSQGIEDIAYKVYTNLHMTRYNLDASSETSSAVQAG